MVLTDENRWRGGRPGPRNYNLEKLKSVRSQLEEQLVFTLPDQRAAILMKIADVTKDIAEMEAAMKPEVTEKEIDSDNLMERFMEMPTSPLICPRCHAEFPREELRVKKDAAYEAWKYRMRDRRRR